MKQQTLGYFGLLLAGFALSVMVGCSDSTTTTPSKAATVLGDSVVLGKGKAISWMKTDDLGNPTSIGVTLTDSALTGLPTDTTVFHGYTIKLPADAIARTAYDHIGLDWNPIGHEPSFIYGAPHFDFHFYQMTSAEQMAIVPPGDSALADKMPPANQMPPDYTSTHGLVPFMGVHWGDTTSAEFRGQPFTKTMIYGFYNGKMVFTEPMITKAYLETKPNVTENLKLPTAYAKTGVYYATKYTVKYDAAAKSWTISLDGLTMR